MNTCVTEYLVRKFLLIIIFIFVFPLSGIYTVSARIPQSQELKDERRDWNIHEDEERPPDEYLSSIDITKVGYKFLENGNISLYSIFSGDKMDDGVYQLYVRMELKLTVDITLRIECLELINSAVAQFSECEVGFWQQQETSYVMVRYYYALPEYQFEWNDRQVSWEFTLDEILLDEDRTRTEMDDLYEPSPTLMIFSTSEITLPELSFDMAVSSENSSLLHDDFFRDLKDTTWMKLYWSANWGYFVIFGFITLVIIWKRQYIKERIGKISQNE